MPSLNQQRPGVISEAAKGSPTYGAVSVGTSATVIVAANTTRRTLSIFNNDASAAMYVGPTDGVTTSNGYPVPAGQSFQDTRCETGWWAVCASGTINARYIEVSSDGP